MSFSTRLRFTIWMKNRVFWASLLSQSVLRREGASSPSAMVHDLASIIAQDRMCPVSKQCAMRQLSSWSQKGGGLEMAQVGGGIYAAVACTECADAEASSHRHSIATDWVTTLHPAATSSGGRSNMLATQGAASNQPAW